MAISAGLGWGYYEFVGSWLREAWAWSIVRADTCFTGQWPNRLPAILTHSSVNT